MLHSVISVIFRVQVWYMRICFFAFKDPVNIHKKFILECYKRLEVGWFCSTAVFLVKILTTAAYLELLLFWSLFIWLSLVVLSSLWWFVVDNL